MPLVKVWANCGQNSLSAKSLGPDSLVFSMWVGALLVVPAEGFEPYAVVGGVDPWRSAKNRCSPGTPSTLGADCGFDSVSNGYTNGYT